MSGTLEDWVREAVANVQVVDVHTHLFPPSHGDLMLWGIDDLLTYHYLVSEAFMVLKPSDITPEKFFQLGKKEQADIVWKTLFVERSPISEAARGVLTTLKLLGIQEFVESRDLNKIREWYAAQDPKEFVEKVFETAGVKYCLMTNIPFEEKETIHWEKDDAKAFSKRFKAAVRIDPLLKGDWETISSTLKKQNYPATIKGFITFLGDWADKIDAIYFMASTPQGFKYDADQKFSYKSMDELEFNGNSTELVDKCLIPIAKEKKLSLALKLGACRGVNTRLNPCGGGDGVETADLQFIKSLAAQYPDLKMLVTVLSRDNQHEIAVIANKFGNVHLYGCWWFCNNPSIIDETTRMRVEILGTAFTAQHSDARILDQLVYKWHHSRKIIAEVLVEKYNDLVETGWKVKKEEVHRDVEFLFGKSYEDFLEK